MFILLLLIDIHFEQIQVSVKRNGCVTCTVYVDLAHVLI